MDQLLLNFFKWAWQLIANIQLLFEWLVTPINLDDYPVFSTLLTPILNLLGLNDIIPLYLVGGGAVLTGAIVMTIGIIRAIA